MSSSQLTREAAEYTLALCARIAAHTDVPGTITRTFLSPATRAVHTLLREEMEALGMTVRVDAIGNLRGLYPALLHTETTPTLLLGSHIDTVPDAGPYDGILGVALPLALLRILHAEARRLPYAIELIAFSEEEGIRFKLPFIGSRALIGALTPADYARTDAEGITITDAAHAFHNPPNNPGAFHNPPGAGAPSQAVSSPEVGSISLSNPLLTPNTFAFLEVHIEQGPILESLNLPLAIVDTISGQSRYQLTFTGQANHAGTTPMHLRRDALAAAAAFITAAETLARATPALVATVGVIHASPGAPNIIPGRCICTLDIRHPDDATRLAHAQLLLAEASRLAHSRNLAFAAIETSHQPSVPMNADLRTALAASLTATGNLPHPMPSGAGHDAMILAPHLPSAMLFLRSPGGISHHPSESVLLEDVQDALEVLLRFLNRLTTT